MEHKIKIISKEWLTHDVIQLTLEKPNGFTYTAGQAIEATLDDPKFKDDWAPFTMTSLNNDEFLEFIIKIYASHNGITLALSKLKVGDSIFITDSWDSFNYKGAGIFIAGGTGITPFIALLRQMHATGKTGKSMLFFANKKEEDIFLANEFEEMLDTNLIHVISREKDSKYFYGRIDKDFLKRHISDFHQPFYLCGPDNFAEEIKGFLTELGAGDELINLSL